jgi:hypothetical protein
MLLESQITINYLIDRYPDIQIVKKCSAYARVKFTLIISKKFQEKKISKPKVKSVLLATCPGRLAQIL